MMKHQGVLSLSIVSAGAWSSDWSWGLPLIVVTVVIHVLGLGFAFRKTIQLSRRELGDGHPKSLFLLAMSSMTLLASVLLGVEGGAWAACYLWLGALPDFKFAMLYSLGAMTTFGHSGVSLEARWQLMGAIEALNGALLFGLTTAYLFATIQKCHQVEREDTTAQPRRKGTANS